MVKKTNKKSSAKSRIFTGIDFSGSRILVYILAFLVFAYFTGGYILQSDKRASIKNAKAIIDDVRVLKLELEQKLGVSLSEDADCTQSSGKTDTKYSSWGCHISFAAQGVDGSYIVSFKELIELQYHTKDKFSNSTNLSDFGFYYFSNPGPTCGTHSQENTVNLYCSFGVDNDAIGDVTKLLGIEQPKGNGRGIFL
ncbi:hypothetical protein IPO96_01980 [Candidatus Saccharibacteria bacterium]|nr:MAG: hypothetical protein IPO96_01980 [Candidatus Saccharibacteria bacterium]